jgi:hypothetical protein
LSLHLSNWRPRRETQGGSGGTLKIPNACSRVKTSASSLYVWGGGAFVLPTKWGGGAQRRRGRLTGWVFTLVRLWNRWPHAEPPDADLSPDASVAEPHGGAHVGLPTSNLCRAVWARAARS